MLRGDDKLVEPGIGLCRRFLPPVWLHLYLWLSMAGRVSFGCFVLTIRCGISTDCLPFR